MSRKSEERAIRWTFYREALSACAIGHTRMRDDAVQWGLALGLKPAKIRHALIEAGVDALDAEGALRWGGGK